MRRSIVVTLLVVGAGTLTALAQTLSFRPGRYEMTTEIDMPAMKMPPEKDVQCITPEDLKNVSTFIDAELAKDCKVSNYKVNGNEMTFNAACDAGGAPLTMSVKMTFAAESFTGLMTATEKGRPVMTVRTSGKRVGECAK